MTEIVKNCPLCGSAASSLFDRRDFRGQQVINVICQGCGLVYQSPRMTETESRAFYESEYRLLYQGQEEPTRKDMAVQTARARVALDFIRKRVNSPTHILDIGCSTGSLLQQFQAFYHVKGHGIEPGNEYRQFARSEGLEVYSSLDELQQAVPYRFNLVSMMHVLEHLPDPLAYLQDLRTTYLEPGGWLLLEVPNLYAHDCFEVAHLTSFSAHTLRQMLKNAGYQIIQLRAHGMPRSKLLPLYLTLLAHPDGIVNYSVTPDKMVHLQRRYGLLRRRIAERLLSQRAWIPIDKI